MILYLVYSLTCSQPPFQVIIPYSCVLTRRASEKYHTHGRRLCIIMVSPGCAGWMCKMVPAPMLGKRALNMMQTAEELHPKMRVLPLENNDTWNDRCHENKLIRGYEWTCHPAAPDICYFYAHLHKYIQYWIKSLSRPGINIESGRTNERQSSSPYGFARLPLRTIQKTTCPEPSPWCNKVAWGANTKLAIFLGFRGLMNT